MVNCGHQFFQGRMFFLNINCDLIYRHFYNRKTSSKDHLPSCMKWHCGEPDHRFWMKEFQHTCSNMSSLMLLVFLCWLPRLQKEEELFISGGYFFRINKFIFIKLLDSEEVFICTVVNVDTTIKNEGIS